MSTVRIGDLRDGVLAFDLRDILVSLAPRSLEALRTVSSVRGADAGDAWFETTSDSSARLEELQQSGRAISGVELLDLARSAVQVIWGEFAATFQGAPWIGIRAVDSTFFEITTEDEVAVDAVRAAFENVCLVGTESGSEGIFI